jgi:hypothetical protein
LRTVTIGWQDIDGFSIGRWWFLGCVLLVHRPGTRPLPVVAVEGVTGAPNRQRSIQAQTISDELNARLARATGRAPQPVPLHIDPSA